VCVCVSREVVTTMSPSLVKHWPMEQQSSKKGSITRHYPLKGLQPLVIYRDSWVCKRLTFREEFRISPILPPLPWQSRQHLRLLYQLDLSESHCQGSLSLVQKLKKKAVAELCCRIRGGQVGHLVEAFPQRKSYGSQKNKVNR